MEETMQWVLSSSGFSIFFFIASVLFLFFAVRGGTGKKRSRHSVGGGVRAYPVIGHMLEFIRNRNRLLEWVTEILSTTPSHTLCFRRFGNLRGVITANPAVIEHVLKASFSNYPKGPRFTATLEDFLGHGIFNADGDLWRMQRKTASFEFNTRSLRSFVVDAVQNEVSGRLLPMLSSAAASGAVLDLQDVLERFAFDNVCRISFGIDPACLGEEGDGGELSARFAEAFRVAGELSAGRFRYAVPELWRLKRALGVGSERRLAQAISTVHDYAMQIIRSRKKETDVGTRAEEDLLSRFIAGGKTSEEFLRDIIISFILAGRETTSSAITWFFWLLSSHPEVEEKILHEINAARGNTEPSVCLGYDDLKEMHYLHAAITESMRLYPPVPITTSRCVKSDVLPDGTEVEEGWFVSYYSYAVGRMESVWGKDCAVFRPERWLEKETGKFVPEKPFKYTAFHAGPRMCLGKEMAYIQMKSIAASLLERFRVELVDPRRQPELMLSLTLRAKGGLPVRITSRR